MAVPTRAEVEAIIAERIAADPAVRDTLLADPRAVLSEVVGFDIPESVQVVLHEESLTQIHLTIPASEALSDADLELVAGGDLLGSLFHLLMGNYELRVTDKGGMRVY